MKFDIDANGILSVSAADKGTGKTADIKITGASTLSEDEVEKMVKDAEAFASEDAAKRDAVDTKNSADSMCYQTEKQLTELGDKIPDDVKEKVTAKVADLRAAVEADDVAQMKEKQEALQQEVMAMGQAMYQGAEGGAPRAAGTPGRRPRAGTSPTTSSTPSSPATSERAVAPEGEGRGETRDARTRDATRLEPARAVARGRRARPARGDR